ncbi:D-amino-acid oxidase, partial [Tremellales sp. Uapishka_1]
MTSQTTKKPIVVLGAGIIGLTTAIRLLESPLSENFDIHVVADHLPNDPPEARYASTAAGAHHLSFADDNDHRQQKWDRRTFEVMHQEYKHLGEASGLLEIRQREFYDGNEKHLKILEEHPEFITHAHDELPAYATHSVSFTSITMTPLIYLNRLLLRLNDSVNIHRHHVESLSYLSDPSITSLIGGLPAAVVVCTGLGASTLGDVRDTTVFPTRGQVVKIKAPWVRKGFTRQIGSLNGGEGGERTYVIPRGDGEVILGGTREINDYHPSPRAETRDSILRRALEICPELAGSKAELEGLVIADLVGFRPSRTEGVRLERGPDLVLESASEKVETRVVYNYGHGGAGWQSCWGTAEDVLDLLAGPLGDLK